VQIYTFFGVPPCENQKSPTKWMIGLRYELRVKKHWQVKDTVLSLFLGTAMIEIDLYTGSAIYLKTPPVHFWIYWDTTITHLKPRRDFGKVFNDIWIIIPGSSLWKVRKLLFFSSTFPIIKARSLKRRNLWVKVVKCFHRPQ